MNTKSLIAFVCLSVLFSFSLRAQQAWSLEQCIDYALKNNIDIRQQKLTESSSRHEVEKSYAMLFPTLNASGSQGYSFGRSVDPFTNEFSNERIMRQDFSLNASLVLFAGFQTVQNIRRSMHAHTALRHDTEKLQHDIVLTIAGAYMQILYFEDFVESLEKQLEVSLQQLHRTRILFEGGTLARGHLLEVEARIAEEELNMITARNNLRMAYLELVLLLDLDTEEAFRIQRPEVEVEANVNIYKADEVYRQALRLEPSVKAAEARILMAKSNLAISRGRISPVVSMVGNVFTGYSEASQRFVSRTPTGEAREIGYTENNLRVFTPAYADVWERKPYKDQINDNLSKYVGLNVRIPIFNQWETRNLIQNARLDLERASGNLELTRNKLHKSIQQAHADALAAYQKYQATLKSREAFEETFKYAQQRFNLGMLSSVEFNESKSRLDRSEIEALQARYDFVFKTKILEFYMGEGFSL